MVCLINKLTTEFPGSKPVSEAAAKFGPVYVAGPITFIFEKVSGLLPAEETAVAEVETASKEVTEEVIAEIKKEEEAETKVEETTTTTTTAPPPPPPATVAAEETPAPAEPAPAEAPAAETETTKPSDAAPEPPKA